MKWASGLAVIGLLGVSVAGCAMDDSSAALRSSQAPVGSKYRFSLPDLEGKTVTLDGLLANHKAVLLNFWATWCPFCVEEIPDLNRLQNQFRDRSFTIVGVDSGEDADDVRAFVKRKPLNYPTVLDTNTSVSETYGVFGLPTSILVRADGKVLGVYHSVTPKLEADIEAALS